MRYIIPALVVVALVGLIAYWPSLNHSHKDTAAPAAVALLAAPPGITFQELRAAPGENDERRVEARLVFANAAGMTAYFNDNDSAADSKCDAHCAETWKPLAVSGEATGIVSAWSVVTRADGTRQWAFKGKPLYTYTGDSRVSDTKGDKTDGVWHIALFDTVSGIAAPYGFGVAPKVNDAAETLVDATGMTLYWSVATASGQRCFPATCVKWVPVTAGALDRSAGDFSIVNYDAGIKQWAYQGHPLFTYTGDKEVGDTHGDGTDPGMEVAKVAKYYTPPGVVLRPNIYGGINYATAEGAVLYLRNRQIPPQGHSLRAGIRTDPRIGRALGTKGCDAACLKERPALIAPADAVPTGYWNVVASEGGARQWTYRGFPLYTYTGDHTPGEMSGNEVYDIDPPNAPVDVGVPSPGGVGLLSWIAVVP